MNIVELMALPFAECLVLVGIHSYLGLHVIKRKVIFVDLAFAQIAALGTTVAYLFHLQPTGPGAYVFSLLFSVLAAAVFAMTRLREERIPQEAVIGLTYALAAAVAILVIDRAPHGAEHIKNIMAGSILWVRASDVAIAAVVYGLVGVFHFVFREKFVLISTDADEARAKGINVRWWDFLFYLSFGIVISLSVRVAGVLLVFVFLIVPAMLGVMITSRLRLQLIIGWIMGVVVSVAGLALSDLGDFPAGPAVVSLYGVVLIVAALVLYVVRAGARRGKAITRTSLGVVCFSLAVGALYLLGTMMSENDFWVYGTRKPRVHTQSHDGHAHVHAPSLDGPENSPLEDEQQPSLAKGSPKAMELMRRLLPMDILEMEETLSAIADEKLLEEVFHAASSDELKFVIARRLFQLCQRIGAVALVVVLGQNSVPMFRSEALDIVKAEAGTDFGFEPFDEPGTQDNQGALKKLESWAGDSRGRRTGSRCRTGRRRGHRPASSGWR
jgi:zinc/manganese transport system permease protein